MISVKLIVYFFGITAVVLSDQYCKICPNHTLCKYTMPGPSSSCKEYDGTPITKDDVNNIINKINERRNLVASGLTELPQAANMNKIYWSQKLAGIAQTWVNQCDASTRPDKEDECRDLEDTMVGQTIASVPGPTSGMQLKSLVDVWFMQILDFKGSVAYYNQSRDGRTNYFTQLIWGDTDRIGCGRARFYVDQRKTIIERLVCNFATKGNIHGRPVYIIGYPATQCSPNKIPDRKFTSLCRYVFEDNGKKTTATTKSTLSSLLRILNLSNKTRMNPGEINLKQVKFDVNETSEQRNQKMRHVIYNNTYAFLKNIAPFPMHSHWNNPSNLSRDQNLHQRKRGPRIYHGHDVHDNNFESNYRDMKSRNYQTQNYPTNDSFPRDQNYRRTFNTAKKWATHSTSHHTNHNKHNECTRKYSSSGGHSEISQPLASQCTRRHTDEKNMNSPSFGITYPCMTTKQCTCGIPSTTCATMPPKCHCNGNCRCFKFEPPRPPFRKSDNNDNKYELRTSTIMYYYGYPNMAHRSAEYSRIPLLKEESQAFSKSEWLEETYPRFTPNKKHDLQQVKEVFLNREMEKEDSDYSYDSTYSRKRKRRIPDGLVTFKPFWQMDEFNTDKSVLFKSMMYTTLPNKKLRKTRRTTTIQRTPQTTETITMKLKDGSKDKQNPKHVTEKYLSFEELMHLRKFTSTEVNTDDWHDRKIDGRRSEKSDTTSTTATYTTNTPFIRKKHCTRKLTCTWTAPTVIDAEGSVIVSGGDRGSRTPPGYVEGCTRTSTCTRDFMDRNKFAVTSEEPGSGEATLEDEDYCEKRALDFRKRDSDGALKINNINYHTYTDAPYTSDVAYTYTHASYNISSTVSIIHRTADNCVCDEENLRVKRQSNDFCCSDSDEKLSYGDLFYLVLQKIIKKWKNNHNALSSRTCYCNSAVKMLWGSSLLLLFIFLYNMLINVFI